MAVNEKPDVKRQMRVERILSEKFTSVQSQQNETSLVKCLRVEMDVHAFVKERRN